MKRRALLAVVASSPPVFAAGCLSDDAESSDASDPPGSSSQPCDSVEITQATVTVEYHCGAGEARSGSVEGRAEDCDAELTLEILDDGETVDDASMGADEQQFSVGFGEGPGQLRAIPSRGDERVRVRGPDGETRAEATLEVEHYLDAPALTVWQPQFEPETVSVGEPVTVTFSVATFGAGTSFTAALLVDGETVATREGTVDGGADCQTASGPSYEFSHAFDAAGSYELTVELTVDGSLDGGNSRTFGTVTVSE